MRGLVSRSRIIRAKAWSTGRTAGGQCGSAGGHGIPGCCVADAQAQAQGRWQHHCQQGALWHAGRWHCHRPIHAREQAWNDGEDHHLRWHRHRDQHARSQGRRRERRARLQQPGRLRGQEPVLRIDHRALCEPHREWHVHARRHRLHAGQEQRAEFAARWHQGLRQGGVEGHHRARRRHVQLHQPGRRGRLSGHAQDRRDVHAHEQERAEDRLPRHHRQGDSRQSHEPHVLQSRR